MTPKAQEPKYKVGLDIGSYAVKMMEIIQTPEQLMLKGLGMKKIAGLPKEEIVNAVKSLSEEMKISVKEAAISVSGQSVIVRFISMPRMKEDELKAAIRFEAEKFIPFNINDCVFDFQVLTRDSGLKPKGGGSAKPDDSKLNILLAVAKKDYVQTKVEMVGRAGLGVTLVDVDSFALANSFVKNVAPTGPDKITALINMGAKSTNLSVLRGGVIVFVRDSAMGSGDSGEAATGGAELGQLLDDIKLSFEYYENQSGRAVDDIYISGSGADLAGLDDAMQEAFGAKPNRWDPLAALTRAPGAPDAVSTDKIKNYFCIAAGLALR